MFHSTYFYNNVIKCEHIQNNPAILNSCKVKLNAGMKLCKRISTWLFVPKKHTQGCEMQLQFKE